MKELLDAIIVAKKVIYLKIAYNKNRKLNAIIVYRIIHILNVHYAAVFDAVNLVILAIIVK